MWTEAKLLLEALISEGWSERLWERGRPAFSNSTRSGTFVANWSFDKPLEVVDRRAPIGWSELVSGREGSARTPPAINCSRPGEECRISAELPSRAAEQNYGLSHDHTAAVTAPLRKAVGGRYRNLWGDIGLSRRSPFFTVAGSRQPPRPTFVMVLI